MREETPADRLWILFECHVCLGEIVFWLLEKVDNVADEVCGNATLLHIAATRTEPIFIEALINRGADVNKRDSENKTPLHWVADGDLNPRIALMLVAKGADINAQDNKGNTLLHLAAKKGAIDLVLSLIEFGADLNIKNNVNNTPKDSVVSNLSMYEALGIIRLIKANAIVQIFEHYKPEQG